MVGIYFHSNPLLDIIQELFFIKFQNTFKGGFTYKIEIWEAYARKPGFLVVDTPKIPFLQYREWDDIE